MINWADLEISQKEMKIIHLIAKRYLLNHNGDMINITMDLEACHCNSPLDLEELLNANEVDFYHDLNGIRYHLDRNTGYLTDCFVPKFSLTN